MVYLMVKNMSQQRALAQEKAMREARFIKDILHRFDVSNTKTLRFEEVRSWLRTIANSQGPGVSEYQARDEMHQAFPGASAGLSALDRDSADEYYSIPEEAKQDWEVTDDEVKWIFMMVMDKKKEGSYQKFIDENGADAVLKLELPPADFERAFLAWRSYVHNKPLLEQVPALHANQPLLSAHARPTSS